jgi:hypothetical protein
MPACIPIYLFIRTYLSALVGMEQEGLLCGTWHIKRTSLSYRQLPDILWIFVSGQPAGLLKLKKQRYD